MDYFIEIMDFALKMMNYALKMVKICIKRSSARCLWSASSTVF